MIYKDLVYGETKISDPLVLDIIKTKEFKRLKHIDQAGFKPFYEPAGMKIDSLEHSRYAHSLGVYILLLSFEAEREELIAGLLHDISHAAFSHCIDYALSSGNEKEQSHQDSIHEKFIKNSNLPHILKKYSIDIEYLLDDSNFPLKETNLPDLCADRIDYSLRTALIFHEASKKDIDQILDDLTIVDGKWVFQTEITAKKYALLFKKMNDEYYCNFSSGAMFAIVGDYLKLALEKKYINENELWTTDGKVVNKINRHLEKDKDLLHLWKLLNKEIPHKNNPKDYDRHVFAKNRIVDPLFLRNNKIIRLSKSDKEWKDIFSRPILAKEYYVQYCI